MDEIENFKNYDIDIADIWYCERIYFFDKKPPNYFSEKLLDAIQTTIVKSTKPIFGKKTNSNDDLYYTHQFDKFTKSLDSLQEQFALDYFFSGDNCFVYNNSISINTTNDYFAYWFIFKLRQYDGKIAEIDNFLEYQLIKNFKMKVPDFLKHLNLSLRQYPELITTRVKETIQEWMNNIEVKQAEIIAEKESEIPVEKKAKMMVEEKVGLPANTIQIRETNKAKTDKERTPLRSNFMWTQNDPMLKNKQLFYLREELVSNSLIDEIKQTKFDNHFSGIIQIDSPINWKDEQFPLIYFIESLKPFLNGAIYTGKNKSIGISKFAPHFKWQGKVIDVLHWIKIKSKNPKNNEKIYQIIDLIISNLPSQR